MLVLALLAAQSAHVAPPMPEGHVHAPPAGTLKTCSAAPVVPRGLEGWRTMTPVAAQRAAVALRTGKSVRATLLPAAQVAYPLAPAKPGAAGTSGGVFAFDVAQPGRYRVALSAAAWIDVVQGGRALESQAHERGPQCSGIRKMVDFDLAPGRYVLQVAGSPTPIVGMIVTKLG